MVRKKFCFIPNMELIENDKGVIITYDWDSSRFIGINYTGDRCDLCDEYYRISDYFMFLNPEDFNDDSGYVLHLCYDCFVKTHKDCEDDDRTITRKQ